MVHSKGVRAEVSACAALLVAASMALMSLGHNTPWRACSATHNALLFSSTLVPAGTPAVHMPGPQAQPCLSMPACSTFEG